MPARRRILTLLLLFALLLLGAQRQPAFACADDDPACQDHCAVLAGSCATACMVRQLPAPPLLLPPPSMAAAVIAFSADLPVPVGVTRAPDLTPPRPVA